MSRERKWERIETPYGAITKPKDTLGEKIRGLAGVLVWLLPLSVVLLGAITLGILKEWLVLRALWRYVFGH